MRFYQAYTTSHTYKHLPAFSNYLLENQLDAFSREQLKLSYEADLPLLKLLKHLGDEKLVEITKTAMVEYLGYLSQNRATELIEISLKRWKSDQLEIIGKFELQAEDITLIGYIRGKSFRKFVPFFTNDINTVLELIDELDSFFTGSTTAATNTYIDILKDQIAKHESNLLEAQRIARIGSFEMDLINHKTQNSPEIYSVFEIQQGTGYHEFMEFIHPDDKNRVEEALAQAMKTGNYECEYRFLINNKIKYIWSKGVILFENGKPVRFIGTIQDITGRKLAEQQVIDKTIA
ncbi:MAG TPA: PAS domain-containing protein, partial [Flavisolibacter sp.]|nr:PAS domain-containing protein [Flavisolibacter sp.]